LLDGPDDQDVDSDQSNDCFVFQSNSATQEARIEDDAQDKDGVSSNSISQSITQSNEACTNTLTATEDGPGDQDVDSDQSNNCTVQQSNSATQQATIVDENSNEDKAEQHAD
jgi:hypothetical protein